MLKNKIFDIKNRTWVRIVLCTVLFVIVAISFAGEKVAKGNGIGWDGEFYYMSTQRFIPLIKHHGYDQYAIQRVMPWGLVDVYAALTDTEISRETAIRFGIAFNAIAILLAVIFFFRISNLKQWQIGTEAIGFAILFFTYPILKFTGYYPVQSDTFGFTLGIMMCYYFLAEKKWALISCGFIGTFIWPLTPILAFALAFFPRKPLLNLKGNEEKWSKNLLQVLFVLIAIIPFFLLTIGTYSYNGNTMLLIKEACSLMRPLTQWIIPFTCICSCVYYYYMVSAFKVSIPSILKENFTGRTNLLNYVLFLLCMVMSLGVCKGLTNSDPGAMTTYRAIQRVTFSSMAEPFVFIQDNFIYFGLGYLLTIIFWKEISKIIMQQGLGYLFVVAIWVFFSINVEARCSIQFIIFPLIALLMYIDTKNIRPIVVAFAGLFSLIHSRFWYPINVPNMEYYFSWDNYEHYVDFPAQRYYMNFGHWQSHEMYAVWMAVTIIVGSILYIGIRRKWFIVKQ